MVAYTTSKGLEAQLKAELRANELGYIVSKPTTECCRYDMILDDGTELKRVQIKYCDCENSSSNNTSGSVRLSLRKFSANGNVRPYYTSKDVDAIIVYVKPIDKLCYFPIETISGKKYINLRFEPSKNNQKTNIWNCFNYIW